MIGFDDERTKAEYWQALELLRQAEQAETWLAEVAAILKSLRDAILQAFRAIAKAIADAIPVSWTLRKPEQQPRPIHHNCKCYLEPVVLPVRLPDKVKAGRTLWWVRR